jgi:ribosomal peptide maturation radical SAM protein 1
MTLDVADVASRPVSFVPLTAKQDDRGGGLSPTTVSVALVNMPFAMADRPSIQCGLLKSALTRVGHEVEVFYLNLEFAAEFGASLYHELSHLRANLLIGEWLFSVAAFGHRTNEEEYRQAGPSVEAFCRTVGVDFEQLCEYRNRILPAWIDGWAESVDWAGYTAVGFTTTFEQNAAAFALARAIKERAPEVAIVFGGANFDGEMGKEYLRVLPFIDYAVVGEGDRALPEMVERLANGDSPLGVQGVIGRCSGEVAGSYPAARVHDMDSVPDPDYDEFFSTLFRLGTHNVLAENQAPLLLIETARGCWWGQKHHCTFCGLNANGMQFRAKSPANALGQLRRLAGRYKIVNFEAVDNILDYKYLEEVCGPLAGERLDYRLFYEVKANLKREQLRTLARSGIKSIQPGIESLNSHVLTLMRKGISMLHNVRCIKWAHYYGIRVMWNILTGFPGETEQDYEDQIRIIPLLRHLPAPQGSGRIWLERFSPYFTDPSFPVHNVRPLDAYRFIYPQELNVSEIAYFFDYEMRDTVPEERHAELHRLVSDWKTAWAGGRKPELVYQRAPDWIQILDSRSGELDAHSFGGLEAAVYESCGETDRTAAQVCAELGGRGMGGAEPELVGAALRRFADLGLALEENGRFLSLALPVNTHW